MKYFLLNINSLHFPELWDKDSFFSEGREIVYKKVMNNFILGRYTFTKIN